MTGGRAAAAEPGHVPRLLDPLRDEGRQLDTGARAHLERSLGAGFGDVIVHIGPASAAAAERAGAAAFTAGRHVVFGPGAYNPASVRGRMLLAHELAHVVQQRRAGVIDAVEALPVGALTRDSGGHQTEHAAALTAAQAALGMSAPVTGSAPAGIAREDKKDERSWREKLLDAAKAKLRDRAMEAMGVVEGVAIEGGQIVDTLAWAESKAVDAVDTAVDYVGKKAGLGESTLTTIKSFNDPNFKRAREEARRLGMVDPDTGAPIVSGKITEAFDSAENALNEHVFAGVAKDDSFFTSREVGQLTGAIGSQVLLAYVGVEEVQVGLKVVSGIGVIKGVFDAIDKNPSGFGRDPKFWTAVAQAFLHLVGLKAASAGKKIVTLIVDVIGTVLSTGSEIAQLQADYSKPPSDERTKALHKDIQALIKALAGAVQQALAHHKSLKAAAGGKVVVADDSAPASRSGSDAPPATQRPTAKRTPGASAAEPPEAAPIIASASGPAVPAAPAAPRTAAAPAEPQPRSTAPGTAAPAEPTSSRVSITARPAAPEAGASEPAATARPASAPASQASQGTSPVNPASPGAGPAPSAPPSPAQARTTRPAVGPAEPEPAAASSSNAGAPAPKRKRLAPGAAVEEAAPARPEAEPSRQKRDTAAASKQAAAGNKAAARRVSAAQVK